MALWPDRSDYRINLSVALLNGGQIEAAANECRKLLAANPDDSRAILLLAEIVEVTGQ